MRKLMAAMSVAMLAFAPAASAQSDGAAPPQAQPPAAQNTQFEGSFSVTARGITAGDFSLSLSFAANNYHAIARRSTSGLARVFLGSSQDYRYEVRGTRVGARLHPSSYTHRGGRRNRTVNAAFANDDVVTTGIPNRPSMGNPPATREQRRGVVDQVSAMAMMMLATGDPCNRTIPVYMDGRSRFDFVMTPNGTQRVNMAGFRGDAIRCRVVFRPIAGFSDPQEQATLTFLFARQPNGMYVPLRLEMPTDDAGVAILQATRFTLTGPRPN